MGTTNAIKKPLNPLHHAVCGLFYILEHLFLGAISVEGAVFVVGQELTATPDKPGATGTYQWKRSVTDDADGVLMATIK